MQPKLGKHSAPGCLSVIIAAAAVALTLLFSLI